MIKINNKSDTVIFHSLMGTYSHLGWVRTEVPDEDIISVTPTNDMLGDTMQVLENLKDEINFEILEIKEYKENQDSNE
ncbi:MAG: hypothetical protein GTN99_05015 [Candidatus Dadabacteria bacterium]|nr:hypothetical protein [Candidatus Dadabacteria bacterium]